MKCIYLRTNTVNGKQYVGQANDFERREYDWHNLKWSYAGKLINNARNKYGTDNFKTEILKECQTQDELNQWEQYYIKELSTKYPNGYNLTDGGDGRSGYQLSDEERKKMSESLKGRKAWNKGIPASEEIKRKLSEAHKGILPSNSKIIYQYTLDGEFVREWKSAQECGRNGYDFSNVCSCCRGERKTHKGFIWSYTKKEDIN